MGQGGNESAQHIKKKITDLAHPIFHIVPKNKENPHISDKMPPSSMQEHIGKEGPENGCPQFMDAVHSDQPYIVGNEPELINKSLSLLIVQYENLKNKYNDIDQDEYPIDNGHAA